MKKREFFKRLLGITAAAVVAPKVLLAEEEAKEVFHSNNQYSIGKRWYDSSEKQILPTGVRVKEVISCDMSTAIVLSDFSFLRVGDIVNVWREGKNSRDFSMVTAISSMGLGSFSVRISSAQRGNLDVKEGDILRVMANSFQENNPKTKK